MPTVQPFRLVIAALLLASCSTPDDTPPLPPAPTELQPLTLAEAGDRSLPIRLSSLLKSAQFTIPESNLPAGSSLPGEFALNKDWVASGEGNKRNIRVWKHRLPIRLKAKKHARAPEGVTVMFKGEEVNFTNLPSKNRSTGWDIDGDHILLLSKENPSRADKPPVVLLNAEKALQNRVNFKNAKLSHADFVTYELTEGPITRTGLLLPAPGRIEWTLDLPAAAQLELHTAMVPRALTEGPQSDGVEFEVLVNGEAILSTKLNTNASLKAHTIDISAFASQTVRLALVSKAGDSSDFDHLFVGEPLIWGESSATPRRVIIVGIDTLRYASVTQHGYERDTTKGLEDIAQRALIFDNAFTPAPRTRPSFRTVLTGRLPLPAIRAQGVAEVMRKVGFTTAGVTANVHLVPRFGFNRGFDYWHYENSVDADVEMRRARKWLDKNKDRDTFLFLHLMDPHNFYRAPGSYKNRYVQNSPDSLTITMNRWKVNNLTRSGKVTPRDQSYFLDRYDGEVAYMADQLGDFLAWVYSLPGETLVVLQSDHGEEFWEHGGYEHNHTLYQEVVHGLLWMIPPNGYAGPSNHNNVPAGLVDIVPTILDAVGVPESLRPPTDGVSLAAFLDGSRKDEADGLQSGMQSRRIPIGHLMYDKERWAVAADQHKYIIQTFSGEEELYNLATDPGEQDNIVSKQSPADMKHWHKALQEATEWPVGTGWRLHLLKATKAFEVHFSNPVQAMALDPESGKSRRANVEWGETSPYGPDDVAKLHFNADKTRMHVKPGKAKKGRIGIIAPPDTIATLVVGDTQKQLSNDGKSMALEGIAIKLVSGTLILPQDSIRNYVGLAEEKGDARQEDLSALKALGYVQ